MTESASVCRSCRSTVVTVVIDLGSQPAADLFPRATDPGPDETWPLALGQCEACFLLQLVGEDAPVPETPLAVESATSKAHAASSARDLVARLDLKPGDSVMEFDSAHGGSWLPELQSLGLVARTEGLADIVLDVHGLIHDFDLDEAIADRVAHLNPDGRFVIEFHHALQLVTRQQFDTIRHGHPVYLSLLALQPVLARHGLRMLSARPAEVYGGSLVLVSGRSGTPDDSISRITDEELAAGLADTQRLRLLNEQVRASAAALHRWLRDARTDGRRVLGYGAPSKAPVLLNLADVGPELLEFTVDLSPAKQGRRLPVTGIPILSPRALVDASPDQVLIFTWDIADEVRRQLTSDGLSGAEYFVPLPEPTKLA
jgi:C-methyltransferase C-terminal domain/Putative zinc binding domain